MGMFRNVTGAMGFGMAALAGNSTRGQRMLAGGALAGGMYGATLGRDPGQSRLGGAMTGALGGAALARYGRAAYRGTRGAGRGMGLGSYVRALGAGAGKFAFAQMHSDARRSARFISSGLNKGKGMFFNALGR